MIEGITAHIQTVGDRHFFQSEWVGLPGSGLGIEAVIIEAGRSIDNSDINYCAYCHNGIQDLVPCGTRSGTVGLNRQIISLKINVGERLRETYDGFIEIIFVGEPGVKKFLFGENCVLENKKPIEAFRIIFNATKPVFRQCPTMEHLTAADGTGTSLAQIEGDRASAGAGRHPSAAYQNRGAPMQRCPPAP